MPRNDCRRGQPGVREPPTVCTRVRQCATQFDGVVRSASHMPPSASLPPSVNGSGRRSTSSIRPTLHRAGRHSWARHGSRREARQSTTISQRGSRGRAQGEQQRPRSLLGHARERSSVGQGPPSSSRRWLVRRRPSRPKRHRKEERTSGRPPLLRRILRRRTGYASLGTRRPKPIGGVPRCGASLPREASGDRWPTSLLLRPSVASPRQLLVLVVVPLGSLQEKRCRSCTVPCD